MTYSFNSYTYSIDNSTIPNFSYMALYERGTVISPYNSYNGSLAFYDNKYLLDYTVANSSHLHYADYGLYYGYCFHLDNYLILNYVNTATYFTIANTGLLPSDISAYIVTNIDNSSQTSWDVNGQFISPHTYFTQNRFGSLTNLINQNDTSEYEDIFEDSMYPVNNPNSYNVLFDYRLATNNDTYYLRGEDYDCYTSYFTIDNTGNNSFLIHLGYDNSLDDEYVRGFGNGKAAGLVEGRDEGYARGKADGLAQGRLEVGNYSGAMDFVGSGITQLMPVFGLEVLPNITLGTVISIPIIVGILSIIFHISRG